MERIRLSLGAIFWITVSCCGGIDRPQGHDEPATHFELLNQRRRDMPKCGCHDHCVERTAFRPSVITVPDLDTHITESGVRTIANTVAPLTPGHRSGPPDRNPSDLTGRDPFGPLGRLLGYVVMIAAIAMLVYTVSGLMRPPG